MQARQLAGNLTNKESPGFRLWGDYNLLGDTVEVLRAVKVVGVCLLE